MEKKSNDIGINRSAVTISSMDKYAKVFRVSDGRLDCVRPTGRYVSVLAPRLTAVVGDIILISLKNSGEYLMLKKCIDPVIKDLFYSDSDEVSWESDSSHEECDWEERVLYGVID